MGLKITRKVGKEEWSLMSTRHLRIIQGMPDSGPKTSRPIKKNSLWILWGYKSTVLGLLQRITCITKRNCLFTCNKASDIFNITSGPKSMDIVLIGEYLKRDECQIKL